MSGSIINQKKQLIGYARKHRFKKMDIRTPVSTAPVSAEELQRLIGCGEQGEHDLRQFLKNGPQAKRLAEADDRTAE